MATDDIELVVNGKGWQDFELSPDLWSSRHPSVAHFQRLFEFGHLPPHLKGVSAHLAVIAETMLIALPDGPELSAGLRKLLEAKDCFVRAAVLSS